MQWVKILELNDKNVLILVNIYCKAFDKFTLFHFFTIKDRRVFMIVHSTRGPFSSLFMSLGREASSSIKHKFFGV